MNKRYKQKGCKKTNPPMNQPCKGRQASASASASASACSLCQQNREDRKGIIP